AAVRRGPAGRSVAAIDRRGVGRYGFFVTTVGGPMRLYEIGPLGLLVDLAPSLGLNRMTGGQGVLAAPLLSDHTDLFCANEGGPNFLFHNRGHGTFEECAARLGLDDPDEHARGAVAVDRGGGRGHRRRRGARTAGGARRVGGAAVGPVPGAGRGRQRLAAGAAADAVRGAGPRGGGAGGPRRPGAGPADRRGQRLPVPVG